MVNKDILPAISSYTGKLCETASRKKSFNVDTSYEDEIITKLSKLTAVIFEKTGELEIVIANIKSAKNTVDEANTFRDVVIPLMNEIRAAVDEAETVTSAEYWPYPSYGDLLFGVK